ncbi:hypothetical protein Droror1_Dr00015130 [Drosera rotundifolia]
MRFIFGLNEQRLGRVTSPLSGPSFSTVGPAVRAKTGPNEPLVGCWASSCAAHNPSVTRSEMNRGGSAQANDGGRWVRSAVHEEQLRVESRLLVRLSSAWVELVGTRETRRQRWV